MKIGAEGAGAGRPPAAGLGNWLTGPSEVGPEQSLGRFLISGWV